MRLTVKRTRSSLKFDLELPSDPPPGVEELQRLIFKKSDIPEWAQRVFYQGRYLRGSGSLSEQGVPAEGGVLLLATSANLLEPPQSSATAASSLPCGSGGASSSTQAPQPKSTPKEPSQSLATAASPVPGGPGGASSSTHEPQAKSMPKAPTRVVHQAVDSSGAAQAMTAFLQMLTTPTNSATATTSSQTTDSSTSAGRPVDRETGAHVAPMQAPPKARPPCLGSPPPQQSERVATAKSPPMKAPPPNIHRTHSAGTGPTSLLSAPLPAASAMPEGSVLHAQASQLPESLRSAMQQVAPQLLSQMQASGAGQQAQHQLFTQMNMAVEQALAGHGTAQVISGSTHSMGTAAAVPMHSVQMLAGGLLPMGLATASDSNSPAGRPPPSDGQGVSPG